MEGKQDFQILTDSVIGKGLCARCGMCSGVCPVNAIALTEDAYPSLTGNCTKCGFCVQCCPGGEVDFPKLSQRIF